MEEKEIILIQKANFLELRETVSPQAHNKEIELACLLTVEKDKSIRLQAELDEALKKMATTEAETAQLYKTQDFTKSG